MRSRAVIALGTFATALVCGGWLVERGVTRGERGIAGARVFDQVMAHVQHDFVDSLDTGAIYRMAVDGMLDELHDPHSVYLPPDRLARFTEGTSGNYAGLGIEIDIRDGWITVIAPMPGAPAERSGIQSGDRIIEIGGKRTQNLSLDDARALLRGEPGSVVQLGVQRSGVSEPLTFSVTRDRVHVASVRHAIMLNDRVGYIDVSIFSDATAPELRQAVEDLRAKGMKTLVFDLRSNPGGLLEQGVAVSDLFLDRGARIVSMRGRTASVTREFADDAAQLWPDLSMITLINGSSASAAEIVAGALQDHDRSVLVGSTSYGKGSAQTVFNVIDGGALKLTTARWYTPSGRSIQKAPAVSSTDDDGSDDTASTSAAVPLARRKAFRTDAGRVVYGGGGITPDLLVAPPDSTRPEAAFIRQLGKDIPHFRDAATDEALSMKAAHVVRAADFSVTPEMRAELWRRLRSRDVTMTRAHFDSAETAVSRLLGYEIARYALGKDAELQRRLEVDRAVAVALQLADGAATEHDLLARAAAMRANKQEDAPRAP